MRATVEDEATLQALKPLDVASYLRSTIWQEKSHVTDYSSTWVPLGDGEEFEILLPLRTDFADYAARMADILRILATAERRSQLDVLSDLFAVSTDVVKVRSLLPSAEDGTLPLHEGVDLLENASNLLIFAACAVEQPRRVYSNRQSRAVTEYIQSLRLGQTERGSYVLAIASPVQPRLTASERGVLYEDYPEPDPFPRKATLGLAWSLIAMHEAAEISAATGTMTPFEDAVSKGVSANLCEATVKLAGQTKRGEVEINFAWSLRRPPDNNVPRRIRFTSDTISYIEEASQWFRRSGALYDAEVKGVVIILKDDPNDSAERTVILGYVDGRPRRISVELSDNSRNIAIEAYTAHSPVRCFGTLVRESNRYILREVHDFMLDTTD